MIEKLLPEEDPLKDIPSKEDADTRRRIMYGIYGSSALNDICEGMRPQVVPVEEYDIPF